MSDIFDWDEEEEKKSEAEVWGTYPLAQPPELRAPPPEPPPKPPDVTASAPPKQLDPWQQPDPWNEVETVLRPRHESRQEYPPYEPDPPQNSWTEYPSDPFDQQPAKPGVWSEYPPETPEETARKGGLAWSAGIVFFSSVAFMLFLGWIADWLLGSSPWGLIAGIVLGSIVGFVQFFRISSQIFNPKKTAAAEHPLMPPDDGQV
jgi:F0F1-type ATP synthase assembly protein I